MKSSNTFLDDDVDDLGKDDDYSQKYSVDWCFVTGFDPFHETQKGLADLLESEAAAQAQQQQTKVASPPPGDWRGPAGAGAGAGGPSPVAGAGAQSRVKLPPPGFHNSNAAHLPSNSMGKCYNCIVSSVT